MSKKFQGFEIPSFTPTPDVFFDEIMTELTLAETRVMLYIIRRTYGFGKQSDGISLGQFEHGITTSDGRVLDKGVGFTRSVICKALKSLLQDGYIVKETRKSKKGGSDPSVYMLNIKQPQKPIEQGGSVTENTRVVSRVTPGGSVTENTRVVSRVTPTKNRKQNTVNTKYSGQEEEEAESVPDHSVSSPPSSSLSSQKKETNGNEVTERVEKVIRLFEQKTGETVDRTPKLINNVNKMLDQHSDVSAEELLECRKLMKQADTGTWFRYREPNLTEIARDYHKHCEKIAAEAARQAELERMKAKSERRVAEWMAKHGEEYEAAFASAFADSTEASDQPASSAPATSDVMREKKERRLAASHERYEEAMKNSPWADGPVKRNDLAELQETGAW